MLCMTQGIAMGELDDAEKAYADAFGTTPTAHSTDANTAAVTSGPASCSMRRGPGCPCGNQN
jgi:hypothetical protein